MMTGIHNLQAFALNIQKTNIKFDLFSLLRKWENMYLYSH
ncbi:hypothetical protein Gogos_018007 [Gossypium gossypioides]|uniref:Uncharacterized protein n=1 Tax=Gossypium gossypioides TaxID=34282 RepID=A0A7J9BEM1_GOSGO|nr:hypothetical protein [Gossypium gossypioides]